MGAKDALLAQKEASLTELGSVNVRLEEQLRQAQNRIASKDAQLSAQQTLLNQKEAQLDEAKQALMISRSDLEKTVRLDQKIKILLVKSPEVTIKDTGEAARIIKNKYPNSSVYLFASLLKQDHEKLVPYQIEPDLLCYQNEPKSVVGMIKLYTKLLLGRFNLAITLASHQQVQGNAGHKKARLMTVLSNSKNQCVYYVD
jgi:multidrug efflux pump subunit AcrA (membrane-fusion protein)